MNIVLKEKYCHFLSLDIIIFNCKNEKILFPEKYLDFFLIEKSYESACKAYAVYFKHKSKFRKLTSKNIFI